MSQYTKKPPVWLWFLLPVLMAAEYFGPVLARAAVAHGLYLDAHPAPGFGQFWMKNLANLAGSMALVLFTLFVCGVVLCYHAGRLRARDAALFTLLACLFSCSGAALFGGMPLESAWVPYVFRAAFLLGSGYLLFLAAEARAKPCRVEGKAVVAAGRTCRACAGGVAYRLGCKGAADRMDCARKRRTAFSRAAVAH